MRGVFKPSASRTDIWPAPSLNWLMNSRETVYTNRKNALEHVQNEMMP